MKNILCYCFIIIFVLVLRAQNESSRYTDFIEKANDYLEEDINIAQAFLDSIPKPLEDYIPMSLDEFYIAQGHVYGFNNEDAKAYQSFLTALKYAKKSKNYAVAGDANIQLFRTVFPDVNDSISSKHLASAKYFFGLSNDKYGLYEIELIDAYSKYLKGDFYESILRLKPNLEKYKAIIDEDGYIYMDANSQIALNYISLDSIKKARTYFQNLKKTKGNPTISLFNYNSFYGTISFEMADYFYEKQQLDSCKYYLNETNKKLKYLDDSYVANYYRLNIDLHKNNKNLDLAEVYIDSLKLYEYNLFESNREASVQLAEVINDAEFKLEEQISTSKNREVLIVVLLLLVIASSILYFLFHKKKGRKLKEVSKTVDSLSYVKLNNEQLALKMHGLEDYLVNLKKEIRDIASQKSTEEQKTKMKSLYAEIHANSSTILNKSDCHLELINELNANFFKKIEELYPNLNKSEIIICYYIVMGFTNREISVFLNSSLRSVESKRYRIAKKIDFDRNSKTFATHLQDTFKETVSQT